MRVLKFVVLALAMVAGACATFGNVPSVGAEWRRSDGGVYAAVDVDPSRVSLTVPLPTVRECGDAGGHCAGYDPP